MTNKSTLVSLALTLALMPSLSQAQKDARYLDQTSPGVKPMVYAPGKVSLPDQFEFGATFSKDRSEFYYGVEINHKAETRVMKFADGKWTTPEKLLVHSVYSFNDPFLSSDEKQLYFISDRSVSGEGPKKDYDIWYIQRENDKWSAPINAGPNINTNANEYYMSFTKNGKMYFSSNGRATDGSRDYDIYSAESKNGKFQPAIAAGPGVNTEHYEADVFVAPDESYLIFAANRPEGLGSGDLYVSFRKPDGTWTPSKSLGDSINTETDDFCPYVTSDGKYLFYASRGDIYWVSTEVVSRLK
ncbi:hypothetical protein WBG78_30510 [Chryseolinea sp. T2]|uniref:hypothetical protein n=1 Tax=Chryseolinea sp. T2 TaxID=3129255 RepID=UPI003077B4BA